MSLLLLCAAPVQAGILDAATFRALDPIVLAVGDEVGPQPFALADLNDDGKLDLVAIETGEDMLNVLLGRGDGTFDPPQSYVLDGTPTAVAVADLTSPFGSDTAGDADGRPDVVVTYDDGGAAIYIGRGDGALDQPEQDLTDVLDSSELIGVVVADFDGNERLDLALLDLFDEVYLLCNVAGTLAPCLTDIIETMGTEPLAIASGDFDGDTAHDLAVLNLDSRNLSPIFGNGDGSFVVGTLIATSAEGEQSPVHFAVGRLDPGITDDIVVANKETLLDFSVVALYGRASRDFRRSNFVAPLGLAAIALGDLDSNAALDLVMLARDDTFATVSFGDESGQFLQPLPPVGFPATVQRAVQVADVDGDTRPDAVFLNGDGSAIQVSLNQTPICAGDCDRNRTVSINELVLAVGIALSSGPASGCTAVDSNRSNTVEINELVAAVGRALDGCG